MLIFRRKYWVRRSINRKWDVLCFEHIPCGWLWGSHALPPSVLRAGTSDAHWRLLPIHRSVKSVDRWQSQQLLWYPKWRQTPLQLWQFLNPKACCSISPLEMKRNGMVGAVLWPPVVLIVPIPVFVDTSFKSLQYTSQAWNQFWPLLWRDL